MLTRVPVAVLLILAPALLGAQNGWFQPSLLAKPEVRKALQSVDDRAAAIVEELEKSGYKPEMFVAIDVSSTEVWYGALSIDQFQFFFTSPGAHTLESRGAPSPAKAVAKAITALYEIPLPPALD